MLNFQELNEVPVDEKIWDTTVQMYDNFIAFLPRLGLGLAIIILGTLIATLIGRLTTSSVKLRTKDPLMSRFLGRAIRFTIIIVFIMVALRAAGLGDISAGILATAGASAVVLGFAFKDIGQNFIAGVILSFNRPFNVNDTVEIGDNFGRVKALMFRYTKLKSFDGKDVYIPNSDVITQPVTNYTEDGFYRWDFVVGIDYDEDIELAKSTIMRALEKDEKVISDENHVNYVIEDELATSTVNLKVFFWVDTLDFGWKANSTRGRVIGRVKRALMEEGYYLPADIQEIKLYGKDSELPLSLTDKRLKKDA
ncbi:mechanosensitive ion channel protein MscS [Nonlabens sp. MIC269]|uniref:mechanosensitive ion channel family protein n=1 Tax=Nonlabens TaxID=363408 RepID=UPI00071F5F55|nr:MULTISPECIES: mechanosensitive ion channel domain-containing protein [Nonlabens]ALM19793.1 mechanosensitive ion channel protein MscS [Nonlabens sp. MIC269]ARN71202.1 mechanosensitive ion channel protein MscS [Nonlabens tegetincola]PQJ17075.1 mechanosensitive ion channel protein MscS [Nonlabens tegetincola]